ncbi:hypothetical protein Lal_00019591 [Lupinus albus]|uniref:H/ACA ribonucleoprotein complex non-core subunit NAF1 n=1 Tax=Lupinus albus TaxID=3870 RepID=A0A6A4R3J4_LUPAL|nr:putative translation protein, beta-barrel [Lupinus albus]KAF1899463.1 hypothetical protein Lal_00019591 [Lupinus albus]
MATQHNINGNNFEDNGIALATHLELELDPNLIGANWVEECEKVGSFHVGFPIEEAVEKISLVDVSQTCVMTTHENGNKDETNGETKDETKYEIKDEIKSESESESEGESEEDSTSEESSRSSSSSSDSNSDSDGDEDDKKEKGEVEEGEIEDSEDDDENESDHNKDGDKMVTWGLDDGDDDIDVLEFDDDDGARGGEPIRSKNEIENLPPVPPVEVTLEPHHQVQPVGVVMSILGAQVIVEGVEKHEPLNEGSILWMTENRKPLGLVDEIFGPVKTPYYIVRYNSESEVPEGIHAGTLISFVPEFADYVLNNKEVYKKGYDASGANDEELSDEYEFSDDEKEAEYRRMQRTTKRDKTDQNQGKRKINRKKSSPKQNVAPSISDTPAPTLPDLGNSSPFQGNWQGHFGGPTLAPHFRIPPSNAGPNFATSGVWTNGTTLPQQPQPALAPNAFPNNGMPWYPQNTQFPHRLSVPGMQFQQQLHPNQGPFLPAMFPGVLPNMFAQPMNAPGLVGQNQMQFGLNTPFQQIQPPVFAAQQGFPSGELQSQGNLNLPSSTVPGAPPQFRPRISSNRDSRGGRTFRGAGRKGWRPSR